MINVKATCPLCGDVKVDISEIKLAIASPAAARDRSFYSFICPRECKQEVIKQATETVIDSLTKAGVTTLAWTVPAEAYEGRPYGREISWDDVLDFTLALDATTDLAVLADSSKEVNL